MRRGKEASSAAAFHLQPTLPHSSMAPHVTQAWGISIFLGFLCTSHGTPRTSLLGSRSLAHFSRPDVGNTSTLLLSYDDATLFVGARNALFSFDVSQPGVITLKNEHNWAPSETETSGCEAKGLNKKVDCPNYIRVLQLLNATHLYACGTFAFQPHETIISTEPLGNPSRPVDAKGRCPYSPFHRNTAVSVDGELYTGTTSDFWGQQPVISRHLSKGQRNNMFLDNTLLLLEEPTFISSSSIPSEGKVYFFFTQVGKEYVFMDKITVSRVAQVCTDDNGGKRVLQQRWTTFGKAQLVCRQEKQLPFGILQDIVTLPPPEGDDPDATLFYGVFSSQWSLASGQSAVCAFRLRDIKAAFSGGYKTFEMGTSTGKINRDSNLGKCGLRNASDAMLNSVKKNFLTDKNVQAVDQKMELLSEESYSRIAAQRTRAANGRDYTVLFLLSESGFLHKAVLLDNGPHIIEKVQVFKQPQLVKSILLSVTKGVVFVGSSEGVTQVPVFDCSFYSTCAECVLARDPFCGWDPDKGACARVSNIPSNAVQDVEHGHLTEQCKVSQNGGSTPVSVGVFSVKQNTSPGSVGSPDHRGLTTSDSDKSTETQNTDRTPTEPGMERVPDDVTIPKVHNVNTRITEEEHPTEVDEATGTNDIAARNKKGVLNTVGRDPNIETRKKAADPCLQPITNTRSYHGDLVAVSILLALVCLCGLVLGGRHWWHRQRRSKTGPQLICRKESEVERPQEREPSVGTDDLPMHRVEKTPL